MICFKPCLSQYAPALWECLHFSHHFHIFLKRAQKSKLNSNLYNVTRKNCYFLFANLMSPENNLFPPCDSALKNVKVIYLRPFIPVTSCCLYANTNLKLCTTLCVVIIIIIIRRKGNIVLIEQDTLYVYFILHTTGTPFSHSLWKHSS